MEFCLIKETPLGYGHWWTKNYIHCVIFILSCVSQQFFLWQLMIVSPTWSHKGVKILWAWIHPSNHACRHAQDNTLRHSLIHSFTPPRPDKSCGIADLSPGEIQSKSYFSESVMFAICEDVTLIRVDIAWGAQGRVGVCVNMWVC